MALLSTSALSAQSGTCITGGSSASCGRERKQPHAFARQGSGTWSPSPHLPSAAQSLARLTLSSPGGRKIVGKCAKRGVQCSADSANIEQLSHKPCPCCQGLARRQLLLGLGAGLSVSCPVGGSASAAESATEALAAWRGSRAQWSEELFARVMATGMGSYEAKVSPLKQSLFEELREGTGPLELLEIGMGTGPNLAMYARPGLHVIGVDPNEAMQPYALAAAERSLMEPRDLNFVSGVGENMPVPDGSVDAVVGTLVLCSVTDVGTVLQEVMRVLKPGGRYYFVEHVAAPEGTAQRVLQGLLDPLQRLLADGCHLTRDPLPLMQAAGFGSLEWQRTEVAGLGLLGPHLLGVARKASSHGQGGVSSSRYFQIRSL